MLPPPLGTVGGFDVRVYVLTLACVCVRERESSQDFVIYQPGAYLYIPDKKYPRYMKSVNVSYQ